MAKRVDVGSIASYFESLDDPRHTLNRRHLLVDIAAIAVCGIICGCDGPTAIHRWARHRQSWLARHLASPNGIPSRDCSRRTLIVLEPEAFQRCFHAWVSDTIAADASSPDRLVAIDGKACRGSRDRAKDLAALHIVSASATEEGIASGQVATDAKSNEITAIPQLSEQIDLKGTLITIDAMGCQKEIVKQIVAGDGDCVIAVKDNQSTLLAAIQTPFFDHLEGNRKGLKPHHHGTHADGHGRIDDRYYDLAEMPRDFACRGDRPWVKTIVYAVRITRHADGSETDEVRYYLSSRSLRGQRFAEAVRCHWGIESTHWVLDVNFCEDDSRTRERTLGNNLSWLRRFAVTLLKRHPDKDSLRGKTMSRMLNTDYRKASPNPLCKRAGMVGPWSVTGIAGMIGLGRVQELSSEASAISRRCSDDMFQGRNRSISDGT